MSFQFRLVNTAIMSFLLSMFMTLWITWINLGLVDDFYILWLKAWGFAFPAAFVCVLILAVPIMKFTHKLFDLLGIKT